MFLSEANNIQKSSVGIGLRRSFIQELVASPDSRIDFLEVAPENFIDCGGRVFEAFEQLASIYPLAAHGLTLACGNPGLDWDYLKKLKTFLRRYHFRYFTDHLCLAGYDNKFFHDLVPLPLTPEFAKKAAIQARAIQDFLELTFGVENISFYAHPIKPEMSEAEFIACFLEESGVSLMLDINNIYVNSFNHQTNAKEFIDRLCDYPIIQCHIAGHFKKSDTLIIDTHGEDIIKPVWDLLDYCMEKIKGKPTILLERDHNIPPLNDLIHEVELIKSRVNKAISK